MCFRIGCLDNRIIDHLSIFIIVIVIIIWIEIEISGCHIHSALWDIVLREDLGGYSVEVDGAQIVIDLCGYVFVLRLIGFGDHMLLPPCRFMLNAHKNTCLPVMALDHVHRRAHVLLEPIDVGAVL